MDLRDLIGEGNVKISDVVREFQKITVGENSIDSEETESETESETLCDSTSISDDTQAFVNQIPAENEEAESEFISDTISNSSDAQDSVNSYSTSQTQRKCDWIERSPK
jgi:hypothetical protein